MTKEIRIVWSSHRLDSQRPNMGIGVKGEKERREQRTMGTMYNKHRERSVHKVQ